MSQQFQEFHWMMDLLQTIDVGLVVIDTHYNVKMWNSFMENHSEKPPREVRGKNLFELFPELPKSWFKHKIKTVLMLKNRAFSTWEQRPHVFPFINYRPITGTAKYMYQNITISPLFAATGEIELISIMIYDVTDVAVKKLELDKANDSLQKLSRTDALTKLFNRGHWEQALSYEFTRFQRYQEPISLVIFDIDHFKKVNDNYGHPAGDEALRQTSKILRQVIRTTDIAGRYGGEEFAVILPQANADQAMIFCERLRKSIQNMEVEHDQQIIQFTISLGISELKEDTKTYLNWIETADKALFESKSAGRNLTTIYREP